MHQVVHEAVHHVQEHRLCCRDEPVIVGALVEGLAEVSHDVLYFSATLVTKHEVGAEHKTAREEEELVL